MLLYFTLNLFYFPPMGPYAIFLLDRKKAYEQIFSENTFQYGEACINQMERLRRINYVTFYEIFMPRLQYRQAYSSVLRPSTRPSLIQVQVQCSLNEGVVISL